MKQQQQHIVHTLTNARANRNPTELKRGLNGCAHVWQRILVQFVTLLRRSIQSFVWYVRHKRNFEIFCLKRFFFCFLCAFLFFLASAFLFSVFYVTFLCFRSSCLSACSSLFVCILLLLFFFGCLAVRVIISFLLQMF